MSQPTFALWLVVKHILRYLIGFFLLVFFYKWLILFIFKLIRMQCLLSRYKKSPNGYCVFLRLNLVFSSLLGNGLFQGVVLNQNIVAQLLQLLSSLESNLCFRNYLQHRLPLHFCGVIIRVLLILLQILSLMLALNILNLISISFVAKCYIMILLLNIFPLLINLLMCLQSIFQEH